MYCTLQEAYNVPSFDPPSRKKKCSPDVQAKASAQAYEAYRRDGGNGTGDFTMYKYATPKAPQGEPIQGTKPLQRRIPYESFKNYESSSAEKEDVLSRPPYRDLEKDRKEYCSTHGICSADQMETFINGAPVEKHESGMPGKTSFTADGKCRAGLDFYETPLSDETKKQFRQVMKTSLNQKTTSTAIPDTTMQYTDMNHVTGYYDDDLEQYLKNAEAKNIPSRFPMNPDAKPSDDLYDPKTSPLQRTLKRFSEHSMQKPLKVETLTGSEESSKKKDSYKSNTSSYGWDIAMFVLAGLLIIILIDQLFKMGVMLGMRHTMELLQPYMKELNEIMKK